MRSLTPMRDARTRKAGRGGCCKNCGSLSLDSRGKAPESITFCMNCGYVVKARSDTKIGRKLPPAVLADGHPDDEPSLVTNKDIRNAWLKQAKAFDQTEANLAEMLCQITVLCQALSLDKEVARKSADICCGVFELTLRGHSLRSAAAACVYASARLHSVGISLSEISLYSKIATSELSPCFKSIQRKLALKIPAPLHSHHAARILKILSLEPKNRTEIDAAVCNKITKIATMPAFQGRNPSGIAGAAIYLAAHSRRIGLTQREIASAIGITESTVMNCCRLLKEKKINF